MRIETADLVIRDSRFEDCETFYIWEKMPEVTEFFSISRDQTKEDVYKKFFDDLALESSRQFTILLKNGGKDEELPMAGRIVLGDIIPGWKGEIWRIYIADRNLRNKGYGAQALKAMLDYCFRDLELKRVYLDFYTGNPAEYLYRKMGFREEGVLRQNCRKDGVLYDVHLMSMLKDEYEELFG